MTQRKKRNLIAFGLIFLSAGLILHNWAHGHSMHFAAGFLIGLSIVLIIAGVIVRSRDVAS